MGKNTSNMRIWVQIPSTHVKSGPKMYVCIFQQGQQQGWGGGEDVEVRNAGGGGERTGRGGELAGQPA